jgi:hypothetical protein
MFSSGFAITALHSWGHMRKYLLAALSIIAGLINAETTELALDANGNPVKISIPSIDDRFTIEE